MFNVMKMGHLFVVDDGFLRLVSHPRHSQEFVEIHRNLKVGECLCGLAAQQGELVICQDCADDERAIMIPKSNQRLFFVILSPAKSLSFNVAEILHSAAPRSE
ncbi:MAG: hypothetical protein KKD99_01885 [Proteobacteria bacterium]|nr:hypothetical protein [Pseudomonadota bacterium]MBU4447308.1 hypothetical protein [Pseudomonadota bacterium]MCG2772208.1 hypothetical protein [Desulfobacterales bacterium]